MIYTVDDIDKLAKESYGVIGCPIEHSLSPEIHSRLSLSNYSRLLIKPDELDLAIPILRDRLKGFNCTIPHKLAIMEYMDYLDDSAINYGAVNTVRINKGKMIGYNTDGKGFIDAITRADIDIRGKKVLLTGAGGVSRVMAFECAKAESKLTIFCRNIESGIYISELIKLRYKMADVTATNCIDYSEKFDVLLNGTPQGMFPKISDMPIDERVLENIGEVFDTIYNPLETKLIKTAKEMGKKTSNGLYMLIAQAIEARKIWKDINDYDEEIIIQALIKELQGKDK